MKRVSLVLSLLATLWCAAADASTPPKVAVFEITGKMGMDHDRIEIFTELLQNEIRARGFQVIGRSDVQNILGMEAMKEELACSDSACAAEIGGALGVAQIVT